MKLLKKIYVKMLSIKVVHSLPGRLRLHVPGLCSIPQHYYFLKEEFIESLKTLPGIVDIELNTVSGRALIQYNSEQVQEEDVLGWIKELWKILARRMAELDRSKPEDELLLEMKQEFKDQLEIVKHEFLE